MPDKKKRHRIGKKSKISSGKLIKQELHYKHPEFINQPHDCLPNFIIIGAAKSATTTLTTILPQHPDIFISKPKEPKFFGRYYKNGWNWYSSRFKQGRAYELRGEGSTMYTSNLSSFKQTAELMHHYLPDLKLIYVVRHPLDRIISQWRHYRGRHPDCADFRDIMRDRHLRRLIVGCSMYYERLSAFRRYYPDNQIHCMTFEDLLSKPSRSLRALLRFLGAKPIVKQLLDTNGNLPKENQAGAKGREYVDKPEWNIALKRKVLRQIRPDSEKMLAYMKKPINYWDL